MNSNYQPKKILLHYSWPKAILHLDGDAFFASVMQATHPHLKGKPVATGAERGVVIAASYEAKAKGVMRGMLTSEAKKICPDLTCFAGDYELYSIYSKRMFAIMRRYTPVVEEYSIDEAFADLGGLRRLHRASYKEIAEKIKNDVEKELNITVSVGLSVSKTLAKLCSNWNKPSGLTVVEGKSIHKLLEMTDLKDIWGFGRNTVSLLEKLGIKNVMDFVNQPETFAKKILGKTGLEIHQELSGKSVYKVNPEEKQTYASISKTKTFTPASTDAQFVYGQLLRNLENALTKARLYHLKSRKISVFLKKQDFHSDFMEIILPKQTSSVLDVSEGLMESFKKLFKNKTEYRATGVILHDLEVVDSTQFNFFEDPLLSLKKEKIVTAIDQVNQNFGRNKVHLADSLITQKYYEQTHHEKTDRLQHLLYGENYRQRLKIPLMRVH